jgi:hypothetical protein
MKDGRRMEGMEGTKDTAALEADFLIEGDVEDGGREGDESPLVAICCVLVVL